MAVSVEDEDPMRNVVACLHLRTSEPLGKEMVYDIEPDDEFDIGRTEIQDCLDIADRCISSHHLRIHCVVYGDSDQAEVAPMVYMQVLSMNAVVLTRHGLDGIHASITVTKADGRVLLNHCDSVQITHQILMDFEDTSKIQQQNFDKLCRLEAVAFAKQYRLSERLLGQGGFASVYIANKQATGKQFACKVISQDNNFGVARAKQQPAGRSEGARREYEILKGLSHPNIVSLDKVICTPHHVYIFQELATGGDLLSYIDRKGQVAEPQAAMIVRQLLEAVKYLHDNNVVHRDIKPENILLTSWRDGARLILTDFGQSRKITDLEDATHAANVRRMHTLVGTVGYIAPEIMQQRRVDVAKSSGYSNAVDMWSVGCTATTLMTGLPLFPDEDISDSQCLSYLASLENSKEWKQIGHRGKACIRKCLEMDERERATAEEALQMPWFTHPHYRAEFDAAYQKAIEDWQPRPHDTNIIEQLDITETIKKHKERSGEDSTRSKHFAADHSASRVSPMVSMVRPNARNDKAEELHASPARSSHTPPRMPVSRPQHHQTWRTSEQSDTFDSIALPPDHDRLTDFSMDEMENVTDISQDISLPPSTQLPSAGTGLFRGL